MADTDSLTQAEYFQHESKLARNALLRLRGEALASLGRTADIGAWTERYPWASLGTVAATSAAAGWALGRAVRKSPGTADEAVEGEPVQAAKTESPSSTSRLVSGLGTLAGSLAAAVATAAAESLGDVVKETIRTSLHPEPSPEQPDVPA